MDLSVIIPIYDEESNVNALYDRLSSVIWGLGLSKFELIFVNDGSKDNSLGLIKKLASQDPAVRYVDLTRNFGHQIAISAGLDLSVGKAVVIIDADLQDPPELIEPLYRKLSEGYDVVYAKRRSREGESLFKQLTAKLFYRLLTQITEVEIPVDTGDFRIISHKVVAALRQMPERSKFLRGQIAWVGYRQTFVEYDRAGRASGESGYTYQKLLQLALDGITAFSDVPLKAATVSGFGVSFIAFVATLYTLYSRFVAHNYVPGWPSLMISVLFLGGVQLVAIGVIGKYLSRLNADVRRRPLYLVANSNLT
ncbi:glycosyltransferase family 2 protein [Hymenobacter arizonensis]|uniref:Dolichol-phosphate mannosyltransferase n=1 Tax=Hymenobacter arizonensis TaxID=1227077 RepID=A0A1I6AXI9_HYMAR|nr:glycosyltransferase family 2 protein [Hymenobacter arizonensis]SFQ73435.1 dolichol-phosphate mannosyltransferase [Hymenobacter arizonensis]